MTGTPKLLSSFLLPITVTIIIPGVLLTMSGIIDAGSFKLRSETKDVLLGLVCLGLGFTLLIGTIRLFLREGDGTLAPWAPTQKLVIKGPYRYVRNPMISGVLFIILGEAFMFHSHYVFFWFMTFFLINHLWFILGEEPNLIKRFGQEYVDYKKAVPRWFPRFTPWKGGN